MSNIKRVILATSLPLALAAAPGARWGHQAVYVPSKKAMYVVGGQVVSTRTQITNDVLVLSLDESNPEFTDGPADSLPPHAFASATLSQDGESLVVLGGITSSCSSDSKIHTLDLSSSSSSWSSASPPDFVRRRGAGAIHLDNRSAGGEVMVVGGVADRYACASGTYTYPAVDTISFPVTSSTTVSSASLPPSLMGTELGVSDFGFAQARDGTVYLVGGQSMSGDSISLDTIGRWTKANGWRSQATTGDVPAGRVGASLVAHPTLDLLILHGGQVDSASTSTVALLNTTSWAWTVPAALQSSSAVAYHSSVVTSEGVMISAFGLGSSSTPSSSVNYLDMRAPSTGSWEWKSSWSSDMLSAYSSNTASTSGTASVKTTAPTAETSNNVAAADVKSGSSSSSNAVKVAVPIVVIFAVLLPLVFWCVRRRVIANKKRREASQFSFSTQEDSGDFRGGYGGRRSRQTQTQYGFGSDANEKEGNVFSDAIAHIRRMSRRRRLSGESDSTEGEREMAQVQTATVKRLDEKTMRWEEIDFGLGELDKRASQGSNSSRNGNVNPFADPVEGQLIDYSEDVEPVETNERRPTIVAVPSASATNGQVVQPAPGFNPSSADGLDWQMLADGMQTKPAFRSIAPTATLRSHAHPAPAPAPIPLPMPMPTPAISAPQGPAPAHNARSSGPPRLPALDFERDAPESPARQPAPRSVSQPMGPRQLLTRTIARVQPPKLEMTSTEPIETLTPVPAPVSLSRRASVPVGGAVKAKSVSSDSSGMGSPVSMSKRNQMNKLMVVNGTEDDDTATEESFGQAI